MTETHYTYMYMYDTCVSHSDRIFIGLVSVNISYCHIFCSHLIVIFLLFSNSVLVGRDQTRTITFHVKQHTNMNILCLS